MGFIFFQKKFQNRAFFGIYGQKSADVSTFLRYTLRENRCTYGPEIFTQAINQSYGGILGSRFSLGFIVFELLKFYAFF